MMDLRNKKILLFVPPFFNYDLEIKNKLLSYGAMVDLYDERPSSNIFIKAIIRIYSKSLSFYAAQYFKKIVAQNRNKKYDIVFILKGEVITRQIIGRVRSAFPEAKFILYLWDSIRNYKEIISCLPLFDRTLTFDSNDSLEMESLIFRPLFYLDDYKKCEFDETKKAIDLLFVGTIHSDRWVFLKEIKEQAEKYKLNVYYYLYIQSPIVFIARKIFDKRLRFLSFKDVRIHSISKTKIIELLKTTKVVIDIQHPKQTGLTMRTIEIIGARKKLLTTNHTIKDYDFYSENNVSIIDRKSPELNLDFWTDKYNELPGEIYDKYSIDGWIKDVFFEL